ADTMSDLQRFSLTLPETEIRIQGFEAPNKVVWFQAKAVCDALGFTNPTRVIQAYCDPEDTQSISNGRGRPQLFLTESAVYDLVFESKTILAKNFKRWLSRDVLTNIRKTGYYIDPNATKAQLESLQRDILHHANWTVDQFLETLEEDQADRRSDWEDF
ncbi:MAG: BRO-N domain-containing protein, partial [Plesiomonas shigelloides]